MHKELMLPTIHFYEYKRVVINKIAFKNSTFASSFSALFDLIFVNRIKSPENESYAGEYLRKV